MTFIPKNALHTSLGASLFMLAYIDEEFFYILKHFNVVNDHHCVMSLNVFTMDRQSWTLGRDWLQNGRCISGAHF